MCSQSKLSQTVAQTLRHVLPLSMKIEKRRTMRRKSVRCWRLKSQQNLPLAARNVLKQPNPQQVSRVVRWQRLHRPEETNLLRTINGLPNKEKAREVELDHKLPILMPLRMLKLLKSVKNERYSCESLRNRLKRRKHVKLRRRKRKRLQPLTLR